MAPMGPPPSPSSYAYAVMTSYSGAKGGGAASFYNMLFEAARILL